MPIGDDESDAPPRLAVRRHTDRCFFRVEEVVPGTLGGYIVDGILFQFDDIAEVVELDEKDRPLPACETPRKKRQATDAEGPASP